jgi:transcriptional regulator with GAF, ATPase, and Fis domain
MRWQELEQEGRAVADVSNQVAGPREATGQVELAEAFVDVADSLVTDFDVIDLLHRLTEHTTGVLGLGAAGVLLADPSGGLQLAAASSQDAELIELFQLQHDEGPCPVAYREAEPVTDTDLAAPDPKWQAFAARAVEAGFHSVHALPMRLRDDVIGAMNLFGTAPGPLPPEVLRVAQAMANVATIAILSERAIREQGSLAVQLRGALTSRVVVEQAKGVIAAQLEVGMDQAFALLRAHARASHQRLAELAHAVVDGSAEVSTLQSQA